MIKISKKIRIPARIGCFAHIVIACLCMYGHAATTYDFAGVTAAGGPHDMYYCDVDVFPFAGNSSNRNSFTETSDANYVAVSASDDVRFQTSDPNFSDEVFLWCEINSITEIPENISRIDFTFEGYLQNSSSNFRIYVMKAGEDWWQTSSWDQVGSDMNIPTGSDSTMIRSLTSNVSDYIDGTGKLVWGVYETVSSQRMRIDYIKIDVDIPPSSITDLEASAGSSEGDIDIDWTAPGEDGATGTAASYTLRYSTLSPVWEDDEFNDSSLSYVWRTEQVRSSGSSYSESDGVLTVTGEGANVWNANDEFHIVYSTITGDFDLKIKVDEQQNTDPWAKAGIMVRNNFNQQAYNNGYCIVAVTPGNGYCFQRDSNEDGYLDYNTNAGITSYPCYLRLKKEYNIATSSYVYSGYYSADGDSWTMIDSVTLEYASAVQNAGMFVSSLSDGTQCTVEFDYIRGGWDSASDVAGEPAPQIYGSAESMTVAGLIPTTTYYFGLKAVDGNSSESIVSNSPNSIPKAIPPAAVTTLSALSGNNAGEVRLEWVSPGDDLWVNNIIGGIVKIQHSHNADEFWALSNAQVDFSTDSVLESDQDCTVTGLTANSSYYFRLWTGDETPLWSDLSNGATSWTLAAEPSWSTLDCSQDTQTLTNTSEFIFSAPGGFGEGCIEYYKVSWDTQPACTSWDTTWSIGNSTWTATFSSDSWYLHLKGYNGNDEESGTFDYGPFEYEPVRPSVIIDWPESNRWYNVLISSYYGTLQDNGVTIDTDTIQFDYSSGGWNPIADEDGVYGTWFDTDDIPDTGETSGIDLQIKIDNILGYTGYSSTYTIKVDTTSAQAPSLTLPGDDTWNAEAAIFDWSGVTDSLSGLKDYELNLSTDINFGIVNYSSVTVKSSSTVAGIFEDNYYWRIRAQDNAGNYSLWSSTWIIKIDTTSAGIPLLVSPADDTWNAQAAVFDWSGVTDALSGLKNYELNLSTDINFGIVNFSSVTAKSSATLSGLEENVYYWRVRSQDNVDNYSDWSATRTIKIDDFPPPVPALINPLDDTWGGTDMVFDWGGVIDGLSGLKDYELNLSTDINFGIVNYSSVTAKSSAAVAGITEDNYYWRVRSRDNLDNYSSWCSTWSIKIDTVSAGVPVLISPGNDTWSADVTVFDWGGVIDSLSGLKDYELNLSTDINFGIVNYSSITVKSSSTVTGIAEDSYYWRVRTQDNAENYSTWSSTWIVKLDTTSAGVPVQAAPADDVYLSSTTLVFDWGGVADSLSGLKDYELNLSTDINFGIINYSSVTVKSSSTLTGVTEDNYYWRLRTQDNAENYSTWSSTWIVKLDTTSAGVPVQAAPADDVYLSSTTLVFDWGGVVDSLSGLKNYELNLSTDINFGIINYSSVTVRSSSTITGLVEGNYYWYIRTCDNVDNYSQWSSTWIIKIDISSPVLSDSVDDGISGWSSDNTPTFTWTPATDTSGIDGYWCAVDDNTPESGGAWTTATSSTTGSLSDGGHTFYVKARNGSGLLSIGRSHSCSIDASSPTAVSVTSIQEIYSSQNQYVSGTTLYYNTSDTGTFRINAAAADSHSGIDRMNLPGLGTGFTGGGDDSSSPYFWDYDWDTDAVNSPGNKDAVAYNNAGLVTTAGSAFAVIHDTTSPAGGSINYVDGWDTTENIAVSFSDGSDAGSGVNSTITQVERNRAQLSNGTTTAWEGWSDIGSLDPVSPYNDNTALDGYGYQYRYLVYDNVSNQCIYSTTNIALIDVSSPVVAAVHLQNGSGHVDDVNDGYDTNGGVAAGVSSVYMDYSRITEINPEKTDFSLRIDTAGVAGSISTKSVELDTSTPTPQLWNFDSLTGMNRLFSKIKHYDKSGNYNVSGSTYYVKPYTPLSPAVSTGPLAEATTALYVNMSSHLSEHTDMVYSIRNITTNEFVQSDGTLDSTEVYRKDTEWGKIKITGLIPNKQYDFEVRSRNYYLNTLKSDYGTSVATHTLSVPPAWSTVLCSNSTGTPYGQSTFTFTASGGFGEGCVEYYKVKWDTHPTCNSWPDTWSSGQLDENADFPSDFWYLHLKGYNYNGREYGTFDYGPLVYSTMVPAITIDWPESDKWYTVPISSYSGTIDIGDGTDVQMNTLEYSVNSGNWTGFDGGNNSTVWESTDVVTEIPDTNETTGDVLQIRIKNEAELWGYSGLCTIQVDTSPPKGNMSISFDNIGYSSMQVTGAELIDDTQGHEYYYFDCITDDNYDSAGWEENIASHVYTLMTANKEYEFIYRVRDGLNNYALWSDTYSEWTRSVPPSWNTVSCNCSTATWYHTNSATFTAIGGFGEGLIDKYMYKWDTSSSGSTYPNTWDSSTLALEAVSNSDSWYLHLKGYNADNTENGTYNFGPFYFSTSAPSISLDWPENDTWYSMEISSYYGTITDHGGFGINMSSLYYTYSDGGMTNFNDDGLAHDWDDTDQIPHTTETSTGGVTLQLRVSDDTGQTGYSIIYAIKVDTSPPISPVGVDDGISIWNSDSTPAFNWTASDDTSGIDGYWWAVDDDTPETDGTWTTTNSATTGVLSDGMHTFYVKAQNGSGLLSTYSLHVSSIDATAPAAPGGLDDGVSGWSTDNTLVFTWTASDDTSGIDGYWWAVDDTTPETGGTWTTLTSATTTALNDGVHSFYIKAQNGAGLLSAYVVHVASIDVTAPDIPAGIDDGVAGWSSDDTVNFTWTLPAETSGIEGYWWAVDDTTPETGGTWTTITSATTTALSEGIHTFYIKAKNYAGLLSINGSHSCSIDISSPTTPTGVDDGVAGWNSDNTPTFTWTAPVDLSGISGYWCAIDDDTPETDGSWTTSTSSTTGSLSDGVYTFYIKAQNGSGLLGTYSVHIASIDVNAPAAPADLDDGVSGWSTDNTPAFTWTAPVDTSGIAGYWWAVDDDSPETGGTWTTITSATTAVLSDGIHTFYAKAQDGAGMISPYALHIASIDATSPQPPSNLIWENGQYSSYTVLTANWDDAYDNAGIVDYYMEVDRDSTGFSSPVFAGWLGTIISSETVSGAYVSNNHSYYYRVKTKNGVGLESDWSSVSSGVYVDTASPAVAVLISPGYDEVINDNTPYFDWSDVIDPSGVSYNIQVDSDNFSLPELDISGISSSFYTSGISLSQGEYHWRVRATDGAGNTGEWTEDWGFFINNAAVLSWTGEGNYTSDGIDPGAGVRFSTFSYRVKYSDADNKAPEYIRIYIDKNGDGDYSDTDEVNGSSMTHSVSGPSWNNDSDYTNGEIYYYGASIFDYDDNPKYKFTASDGITEAGGIAVTIHNGPILSFPITFVNPVPAGLQNTTEVTCSITALTPGDAAIDETTITYEVFCNNESVNSGGSSASCSSINADKTEAVFSVATDVFEEGDENYIQWSCKDAWGGLWKSGTYKVRIKPNTAPKVDVLQPMNNGYATLNPLIEASLTDEESGIDISSIIIRIDNMAGTNIMTVNSGENPGIFDSSTGKVSYTNENNFLTNGNRYKLSISVRDTGYNNSKETVESIIFTAKSGMIADLVNYPNPFDPGQRQTTISYVLEKDATVTINIYDVSRKLVKTVVKREARKKGLNEDKWGGVDYANLSLANGIYFCEIIADDGDEHRLYNAIAIFGK